MVSGRGKSSSIEFGNRLNERSGRSTGHVEPATENRKRVVEILAGLTMVIRHHGAPEAVVASFNQQASDYLDVSSESLFIKKAKYMLTVPMAQYLKNTLPASPDGELLLWKGSFLRWMKPRLRSFRSKNTHLWYSFLQGKRSAAPVSKDIVLSNFQKHREQMMATDPLTGHQDDDVVLDELMELLEPYLDGLSKKMEYALGDFFDSPTDFKHHASNNASFESSRKTGGQAGFLRDAVRSVDLLDSGDLRGMRVETGPHTLEGVLSYSSVLETRDRRRELDELSDLISQEILRGNEGIPRYDAMIEAVLEPLKVRTISKGPSVPYYLAKVVQMALHGIMRKDEPFKLIGAPFCPTDLDSVRQSYKSNWLRDYDDANWISVDYSSATDGLSARYSAEILDRILARLSVRNLGLSNVLKGVLAPHRIHYPPVKTKNGMVTLKEVDQVNGQLMGSVLSFPILCIANLGVFLYVKSRRFPGINPMTLLNSVRINGDDMLYIGSHTDWLLHHKVGARVGLAMSPGKAYIHKRYANINSVSVDCDLSGYEEFGRLATPLKVGYFNTGLMMGKHKVQSTVSRDGIEEFSYPLSASLNELLSGSLEEKRIEVLKLYLSMHKNELLKETRGRNLFLPVSVGGMGVVPPVVSVRGQPLLKWKFTITDQQRQWAGSLFSKSPLNAVMERPLPFGIEPRDVEASKIVDPLSNVIEAEPFRKFARGSMRNLKRALLFGIGSFISFGAPEDSSVSSVDSGYSSE